MNKKFEAICKAPGRVLINEDWHWERVVPEKTPKTRKQKRIGKHLSRNPKDRQARKIYKTLENARSVLFWRGTVRATNEI